MLNIEDIKLSLGIDHSLDDNMIFGLIDTAKYYIVSAIDTNADSMTIEGYKQFEWGCQHVVTTLVH